MSTYLVTVPGTFLDPPGDRAREALVRALRPADPQGTDLGQAEELDILTDYGGTNAFSLRLEVTADSAPAAEEAARGMAASAVRAAGLSPERVPLGEPVITGLDKR